MERGRPNGRPLCLNGLFLWIAAQDSCSYQLPPALAGGRPARRRLKPKIQKCGFDPNSFS
jgi:hypothetical protein